MISRSGLALFDLRDLAVEGQMQETALRATRAWRKEIHNRILPDEFSAAQAVWRELQHGSDIISEDDFWAFSTRQPGNSTKLGG